MFPCRSDWSFLLLSSGFSERFDPAWYLERVVVKGNRAEWVFPCRRWLAKDREDGQTRRTLYSRVAETTVNYKLTVFTGDRPGGGTTGRVHVRIEGGAWIELRNPSVHDTFERGQKVDSPPCLPPLPIPLPTASSPSLSSARGTSSPSLTAPTAPPTPCNRTCL